MGATSWSEKLGVFCVSLEHRLYQLYHPFPGGSKDDVIVFLLFEEYMGEVCKQHSQCHPIQAPEQSVRMSPENREGRYFSTRRVRDKSLTVGIFSEEQFPWS